MPYEPVIGLEVHAQMSTRTKIFCGCSTAFGAEANTHGCPVCLGLPGALPVLNREAVALALRMALAVGCTVQPRSRFLRKNYFYPDLPKGYQISQFQSNEEMPLATGGGIDIPSEEGEKRIRLVRIHMEEDAGKSIHEEDFVAASESMVDVNRCGVPLMEIVSEPDLASADEAVDYLTRLRQVLVYTAASEAEMEKGHMRIDANVSVRPVGAAELGVKVEIKNMNSIRNCGRAVGAEIRRQIGTLETGGTITQETHLYDPALDEVRPMRGKESSDDYRYFPEPDLVPIAVDAHWVDRIRKSLPELPEPKRERFLSQFGLTADQVDVLTASRDTADYFEAVVSAGAPPGPSANWVQGHVLRALNEEKVRIEELKATPDLLARLIAMVAGGTISNSVGRSVFGEMVRSGESPEQIVERKGLSQISDASALEDVVSKVVADNPDAVTRYRDGQKQVLGFFMGQIMKATRGQANPKMANQLLQQKLSAP